MVTGIFLRRAEKVYAGGVASRGAAVKCSICHTGGCRSTCPFPRTLEDRQHSSRNIPAHVVSHLEDSFSTSSAEPIFSSVSVIKMITSASSSTGPSWRIVLQIGKQRGQMHNTAHKTEGFSCPNHTNLNYFRLRILFAASSNPFACFSAISAPS